MSGLSSSDAGAWSPPAPPSRRRTWPLAIALIVVLVVGAAWVVSRIELALNGGLADAPPESEYLTEAEIGTRGDKANPGELFGDRYTCTEEEERESACPDVQERELDHPARLSGYTTVVRSVERVPAAEVVDGYSGDFLKLDVTVFNRDREAQNEGAVDFKVVGGEDMALEPEVVPAPVVPAYVTLESCDRLDGDVYVYVGDLTGDLFVRYRPGDEGLFSSSAFGVWQVPDSAVE